jgi:biopolymer transport protein ExbD
MAKPKLESTSEEIDMTPMIDLVFLLIIFFILAGKISSETRTQQITVPPTKTATKLEVKDRIIINVFGTTKEGSPPRNSIRVGNQTFQAKGVDDYSAYSQLRALLDRAYDRADKTPDVKNPKLQIPEVVLEIRADADTEYRVVQEVLQVVTDSVEPDDQMRPNTLAPEQLKPFIAINYTTRLPGENK